MTASPAFVIIDTISIDETVAFYTQKLGFEIDRQNPEFAQFCTPNGGTTLAAQRRDGVAPAQGIELWWDTDNADTLYATLTGRDVPIAYPPTDFPFGRAFGIIDPSGHTLHMLQAR
ncbi:MAG: VOC family protein [Anaerolineae bacterium]|nr:VOC family protein [Anaerolineae bacterium]